MAKSDPAIYVTKASGEQEEYDETKLRRSLAKAGADSESIDIITESVGKILQNGIPTHELYKEAFRLLRQRSHRSAGRYKLKEAILELGPTGHPFEKFIGELLHRIGYTTEVSVIVKGDCVSHEIDVLAEKDDEHFMIECKFHNRKGHACDVKIPLYIQSRFKDVEKNWSSQPGHKGKLHQGWVVTNTRFTSDAIKYGECVNLKLLSWDYPKREGLKDLIDEAKLYPITTVSSLSRKEKQRILELGTVFCSELCKDEEVLKEAGIESRKISRILKEASAICNQHD